MRKAWTLLVLSVLIAGTGLLFNLQSADAAFHIMRIYGVMGGAVGDANIQYVELRMADPGQNLVAGHDICFFDASGAPYARFRFAANVASGADEASILVGTSEFDSNWPVGSPDVTFSAANTTAIAGGADVMHPVRAPAGRVSFGTDAAVTPSLMCAGSFAVIDSLAYGTGYTGTVDGGFATTCAAYTVSAASAVLGFIPPDPFTLTPPTGASILAQPGTPLSPPILPAGCPAGGLPCVAVPPVMIGLVPGDDIDALCWFDVILPGVPNLPIGALGPGSLGDIYLYSLTPGSPSAAALGGAASIIRAGGGIFGASVVTPPGALGLLPTDNLDALICHSMDGDGDGVPDPLDNCPTVPNPGQQDTDVDGIGDACDTEGPSPNTNGLGGADDCFDGVDNNANGFTDGADPGCGDSDGDGIPDALDNCPTIPNPGQANADFDAFGDACDTEGPSPNTNGLGGADDCYDGVDNDGDGLTDVPDTGCGDTDADGYPDEVEAGVPVCLGAVNDDNMDAGDANINDGCPAVGGAEVLCANAVDDDLDGRVNDGCPTVGLLSEGAYNIGTSAVGPCSAGAVPNPSPSWPSDFVSGGIPNSTDRITITDLTSFLAPVRRLNTRPDVVPPPGSAFSARWDLAPGRGLFPNWIVINDITALIAGSSGSPPMFGGVRAFNGPVCVGP